MKLKGKYRPEADLLQGKFSAISLPFLSEKMKCEWASIPLPLILSDHYTYFSRAMTSVTDTNLRAGKSHKICFIAEGISKSPMRFTLANKC